jgi:SM-20-related protein
LTVPAPSGLAAAAKARCPHLLFCDFLGRETVTALLAYAAAREQDFKPGLVHYRHSGEDQVEPTIRSCYRLSDLGPFARPFRSKLESIAQNALGQLRLFETAVAPREFEITAFRDGDRFTPHNDSMEWQGEVRVLSCIYYFAATPRRFSGGNLRLHGFPSLAAHGESEPPTIDIEPATDTLVVFPAWLCHEVTPVEAPSRAWCDSRFSITCFMHRRVDTADAAPAGRHLAETGR